MTSGRHLFLFLNLTSTIWSLTWILPSWPATLSSTTFTRQKIFQEITFISKARGDLHFYIFLVFSEIQFFFLSSWLIGCFYPCIINLEVFRKRPRNRVFIKERQIERKEKTATNTRLTGRRRILSHVYLLPSQLPMCHTMDVSCYPS